MLLDIQIFSQNYSYKNIFQNIPSHSNSIVSINSDIILVIEAILKKNSSLLIIDDAMNAVKIFQLIVALRHKSIEKFAKKLPILILSSNINENTCQNYVNLGANMVLKLPASFMQIEVMVDELLTVNFQSEAHGDGFRPLARNSFKPVPQKLQENTNYDTWLV